MSFGEILHTIADQDRRTCPNEVRYPISPTKRCCRSQPLFLTPLQRCKQESCPVKRYLLREPDIFTLGACILLSVDFKF